MGEGQKNVPKLRFKGYEDAWEQSELGEVLSELYNGQTPSRFREENWNGDINWLTSGELNRGTVYKTIEKITRIGQVDANLRIVPEGIFVMAITGLEAAGTRGNCAILGIPTTLNQSCMALFPKDNILFTGFLFQWYKKNGEKYGLVYTQGTKQRSYNAELIKKLPIAFPDYAEQKRLSTILRKLDKNLTLYQDLIEGLQKMKKTILSKMFPKDGEDVPEVRFKGFTDAWEQRKLGTIITVHPSKDLIVEAIEDEGRSIVVQQGDSPILGYSNAEGFEGYINVTIFGDHTVSLYKPQLPFVIATDGVKILSSSILQHQYFYTVLEKYKPIPQGYKRHFSILKEQIANITVNKDEQKKIGEFFETIGDLITLHQRKLDELKNMKKTLLQQMFV